MADSFLNPQDQANLDALRSRLEQLDADFKGYADMVTAEGRALREAQSGRRATARETGSTTRSTRTALPSLQKEVEAVNEQVVSYERLNQLIAERIELEARAAAASRETAAATTAGAGTSVKGAGLATEETAAAAAAASLQRLKQEGGLGFQQAGSVQRVLNSLGAGAGAAGAATQTKALGQAQQQAASSARTFAMSEAEVRAEVQGAAAAMVEYDDALANTGGLSSVALKALANGTLTLRDLGNQVSQTIGKFGGWALAGAAVYGVLGAVNELKQGAVDTSSAIQGLTKFIPAGQFNPDAARQSIIDQGRQTATPLNDVGNTAQQFSKVFHNQGDVFTATHVALTAAKLDNITLADSYKYLTAIVQETGHGASYLPQIFDQITAAQDRLGARMSQLLPAFAGSIGAVQTAGGDANQLLGLQALTLVRTGRSGSQVATAYGRGATNFFPSAQSRGVLERLGIDPNQGFTQALSQSIRKSSGQNIPEGERRELAQAFFGKQFGSRFTGLFNSSPQQLDRYLTETQPGNSRGLAQQQLGKTMGQANNQLALLKVNLQAIGAELTGSKMTTPFSALLAVINETLKATADLIHEWDELPSTVKSVGSSAAVAMAGLALARRFNVGGMLSASSNGALQAVAPVFSRSPQKVLETQVGTYMDGLKGAITGQLQSATVQQMRSSLALAAAQNEMAALEQEGKVGTEAYIAAQERAAAAFDASSAAKADISFYAAMGSEQNLARYRSDLMAGGGRSGPAVIPGGGAGAAGASRGAAEAAVAEEELAGETTALTGGMLTLNSALTVASEKLAQFGGMAIPAAIAALAAFDIAKQSISATHQNENKGLKELENAKTPQQAWAGYDKYINGGTLHLPLIGNITSSLFGGGDEQAGSAALLSQLGLIDAQKKAQEASDRLQSHVRDLEQSGNDRGALSAFKNDRALKLLNPGQYNSEFNSLWTQVEGAQTTGKNGANPFAKWEHASQDLANQLEPMMQAIGNASKVFGTSQGNLDDLANGYMYAVAKFGKNAGDTKAMQTLEQAQQDLVSATDKQVQDLTNLAQMATTTSGQRSYYQRAIQAVGKTESDIRKASSEALKLPGADKGKIQAAEQEALGLVASRRQSAVQGLLSLMQSQTDLSVSRVSGIGPAADLQRAEVQLQGLQSQLSTARQAGADAQTVNELLSKVNQQAVTVLQDRVNYLEQLSQAVTQYQQAGTADPIQQSQIAVTQLQQLYTKLVAAGDTDKVQLLGILGQERSAALQGVANQISQEQAQQQTALAQMNIGQPQQVQLQNAVTVAQREVDFLRGLPSSQVNPTTMLSALQNLYSAQGALAQFIIQQGEQLIQAETQLKQGQTFDPVAIANLALQGAKQLLAYDQQHNMPLATIRADQANVASSYKAAQEAQWQKTQATIQFLASTYQITGAQEIQRLKALMVTMKKAHASYSDIQQVAQEIWNLEYGNSGQLNLNTGAMHMPTTYEVKSAIIGANGAAKRKTSAGLLADVKTNVNMNVVINKDVDVKKFTDAIHQALGTSVNGLAQAAGLV